MHHARASFPLAISCKELDSSRPVQFALGPGSVRTGRVNLSLIIPVCARLEWKHRKKAKKKKNKKRAFMNYRSGRARSAAHAVRLELEIN